MREEGVRCVVEVEGASCCCDWEAVLVEKSRAARVVSLDWEERIGSARVRIERGWVVVVELRRVRRVCGVGGEVGSAMVWLSMMLGVECESGREVCTREWRILRPRLGGIAQRNLTWKDGSELGMSTCQDFHCLPNILSSQRFRRSKKSWE